MSDFKPKTTRSSDTIVLNHSIKDVFPLFTPEGEKLWVEGWNPIYMNSQDGKTEEGLIFTTDAYNENTIWYVLNYDEFNKKAKYLRITPGSRIGTVSVNCLEVNENSTSVEITYELTSLSEKGNEGLKEFTDTNFINYIESWKTALEKYFAIV